MKKLIRDTPFDVAFVNGIYSWYFSILPLLLLKFYKKQGIVSARGMLSPHALGVKSLRKSFFLTLARLLGLYKNVIFHATNNDEAIFIKGIIGERCSIRVAPNLPKKVVSKRKQTDKTSGQLHLVYIGRIAPEKNTLFALQILQTLSVNVSFSIYGSVYDQVYWSECEKIIRQLPQNIQVVYHGPVEPEKIPVILGEHHFLFHPGKGENYGHTIAESLQCGCPVIISDRTPWKGLQHVQSPRFKVQGLDNETAMTSSESETSNLKPTGVGWDLPLEEPERFVEVIKYCAHMGQEAYNAMSERAFKYAEQVTADPAVIEANRRLFA